MATNGFFGKMAAFVGAAASLAGGWSKPSTRNSGAPIGEKKWAGRAKLKNPSTSYGRKKAKGAFGGTGTGRNLRGKPGVKLLKKTVKAGFKAQKRVVFGMSGRTK